MFICPICKKFLIKKENKLVCAQNHSFDFARQGYVNLLPVSGKKSKAPGDNEIMTEARREFLSSGHYYPLLLKLKEIIAKKSPLVLVDAGCSEGYYTQNISEEAKSVYAFDISKTAVKLASQKDKKSNYFVASSFHIPLKSDSVDIITKIFAPDSPEEFERILKLDGILIEVIPSTRHLLELKEKLYEKVYLNKVDEPKKKGFLLSEEIEIEYKFRPTKEERQNLYKMTPYYYKTEVNGQNKLLGEEEFEITAHFILRIFQKG